MLILKPVGEKIFFPAIDSSRQSTTCAFSTYLLLDTRRWARPVQAHLSAVFSSNFENIAIFLQAITGLSWSLGDGTPHVADLRINQLENIKLIYDLDSLASLIKTHLPGDFANPQYYPDSDTPIGQRLAEQFIFVYNNWKKDGELRVAGVDIDDIQNKAVASDPEPEDG